MVAMTRQRIVGMEWLENSYLRYFTSMSLIKVTTFCFIEYAIICIWYSYRKQILPLEIWQLLMSVREVLILQCHSWIWVSLHKSIIMYMSKFCSIGCVAIFYIDYYIHYQFMTHIKLNLKFQRICILHRIRWWLSKCIKISFS